MTKTERLRRVTLTAPLFLGRLEEKEKQSWSSLATRLNREEPKLKTKLGLRTDDDGTFVVLIPKTK